MIDLYITKPENVVLCNDEFFTSKTYKKVIDNIDVLQEVAKLEGVELRGRDIISKFTGEILHLNNLSTGCKTLLNILTFPEQIFFIGECGSEVLEKIFQLKAASLYAPNIYLPLNNIKNTINVFLDGKNIKFDDTDSLYEWWCNYYES